MWKNKRANLQGLRGIAILLVLLMHLEPKSFRFGFVGVDIFFVLSGYLMAKILLRKVLTLQSIWDFYCRRFRRIVPLYMIVVFIIYIYGYFYVLPFDRKQISVDLPWVYTYTSNLQPVFQKQGYWDQLSTYRFFVHTWSLGVELQYYLVVPLIMSVALYFRRSRLGLFFFLGAFSLAFQLFAPSKLSYGFLLSRIWQFMCGSIVYEISKPHSSTCDDKSISDRKLTIIQKKGSRMYIDRLITNLLLIGLSTLSVISPKDVSDHTARICATSVAGIVIYVNANVCLLTNCFIVYCGDISYVLYLVHWPIIVAVRYFVDSQTLTITGVLIVLFVSITISVVLHHTLEEFFMRKSTFIAFICVIACYVGIFSSKSMYLYTPRLESIHPITSKIKFAIEWNTKEAHKVYYKIPCDEDIDSHLYTNFSREPQLRCVAKGNGTANILLLGNSIAYRAYPLIHDILRGRYYKFRLFSKSVCPLLSNWCPEVTEAMRKLVQHEKPDIVFYMHQCVYAPFVDPVTDFRTDLIYNQFQNNVDFIRAKFFPLTFGFLIFLTQTTKYSKHIVIDMPYYRPAFNVGASLARRLYRGLLPGEKFLITRQEYVNQTRYHNVRISSIKCSKCIRNDINEGLFKNEIFYLYDPETFLARVGDHVHLTPVGLELLRPIYTRIIEKLLQSPYDRFSSES